VTLALARRGVSTVLLEAEPEPGLCASGTNSGILHTAFDSAPGDIETELILAAAAQRDAVIEALGIPVLRCGAVMRPHDESQRDAILALVANAHRNRVAVRQRGDGGLDIPTEAVTDPVVYTLALARAAQRLGAHLRTGARVDAVERTGVAMTVHTADGSAISCRLVVNCAGLEADAVARMVGDD
jgi:glycerol-3-phosphate dehydrogenase